MVWLFSLEYGQSTAYWLLTWQSWDIIMRLIWQSNEKILNKSESSSQLIMIFLLVPGGSDGKASAYNAGDPGSIPGSGRSPGEGNGNPLQYSCLENPMDGGAWWATVHGVAESWTRLSDFTSSLWEQNNTVLSIRRHFVSMYQIIEITQKNTKCTISYDFAWYNSKNLWKNS